MDRNLERVLFLIAGMTKCEHLTEVVRAAAMQAHDHQCGRELADALEKTVRAWRTPTHLIALEATEPAPTSPPTGEV